jgi:hypothetical protein
MVETIKRYAKFVIAAAGFAALVATEVILTPDQDLSEPEGWVRVAIAVATALLVKQVRNEDVSADDGVPDHAEV